MDGQLTSSAIGRQGGRGFHVAAVLGLTVAAFGLRMIVTRSIWLDEAISIAQAQLPFDEMLAGLAAYDVHPPLHHAVLWLTVRLLGTGELAVRLPSIIAGTLLVPTLYGAGRDLYDRRVGLAAAALGAIAPIAIWYSQEARMYAIFMLFSLIALWAQVRALRTGRLGGWAVYSLATAAMIWTQYAAVLQVLVQQGAFAVAYWQRRRTGEHRRLRRAWIASTVTILLLLAPLWPLLEGQLHAYADRSAGQVLPAQAGLGATRPSEQLSVYAFIAAIVWSVWGYHADGPMAQIVALWPLGMLLLLLLLGRGYSQLSTLLLAVAAIPALLLFAVGLAQRNLFEPRYFAGAVSAGLLLMARLASSANNRGARTVVVGLVATSLLVGLADQQLNGANPRLYDFRGALVQVASRAGPKDVVIYEPDFIGPVVDYYAAQLDAKPLNEGVPPPDRRRRVFLIGSFLQEPRSASQVGRAVEQLSLRRRRVDEFRTPNVTVWVFR
jgi:uncharacterized membrane protein